MDIDPDNILQAPLAFLRSTIAATNAWDAWCGPDEDTLAHVGIYCIDGDYPRAALGWADDLNIERQELAGDGPWDLSGSIALAFSDRANHVDEADQSEDAAAEMIAHLALVGGVLAELGQLVDGRHGYLLQRIELDEAPYRTREERRGCHRDTITSIWLLDVQVVS
jgi:hypothetical protein